MADREAGSLRGLREWLDKLDSGLDSALNRTFDPTKPVSASDTTRRAGRFALRRAAGGGRAAARASRKLRRLERRGLQYVIAVRAAKKGVPPVAKVVAHPKLVIMAALILTLLLSLPSVFIFGAPGLGIKSGMRADLQAFLPQDDPTTAILNEVAKNYSTDLLIGVFDLYVPGDNITDVQWMKQISGFEGDMEFVNETGDPLGVDWRLDDVGFLDGVNWTLSVPTLVKVNATALANTMKAINSIYPQFPDSAIPNATYAIPDDQASIDGVVDNMDPAQRHALIVNREGKQDGKYDRIVVLFGLANDLGQQDKVIQRAQGLANALNAKNGGNMVARISGPVIVFRDLQQGVSRELGTALPFIIAGLVGVLYFWHRQWKVILLTLIPVVLASGIAYGIVGMAHIAGPATVVLAPQVVLAAPMLLAIGVSYGLYLANRYVEEPEGDTGKRVVNSVVSINPAIFLSAVATGIGFFALMIGTLPPIWTLGLALTAGIAVTYIFVYALLPAFIMLGGYEKRVHFKSMKRISAFPERHRVIIVLVAFSFVGASLAVLASNKISFDVDYLTLAPAGTPSVEAMRDYSATMGGGQLGVVLAKGNFQQVTPLDELDKVQESFTGVKNVQSISIVTIMRLVRAPDSVNIGPVPIHLPVSPSFWDLLHSTTDATTQANLLTVFYGAIPIELRSMLVDAKIQSAVVYIIMPFLAVDQTRVAVGDVNHAVDASAEARTSTTILHMAGIQTVTLAVNDLIISGQIISLCVALFLTFVHIWLVFGSLKVALLTMVPVSVVSTLEPLILVMLNVPLSTVTVMIGSIAIGTGVDFAVQITQRMRLEGYTQTSVNRAVENAGISFIEATSTMVAGFAGMFAMNIGSIQQFVLMIITLLVLNMIMALFLYPALAAIWIRRRRAVPPPEGLYTRAINYVKREWIMKEREPVATSATEPVR